MNHYPATFTFALSPEARPLTPQCNCWSAPLPVSRKDVGRPQRCHKVVGVVTNGDYFTAVRHFLTKSDNRMLCGAVGRIADQAVVSADIKSISVYLVKHGAFYHPAYIVVEALGRRYTFVLNVAISAEGREVIANEYHSLIQLNETLTSPFWPRVFGIGRGEDLHGRDFPMFLGQWFEGYYEFHLTADDPAQRQTVIWDTARGHRMLSRKQVADCMGQAAMILTYAYNPLTFEAIRNWHHAAGDFIIDTADDRIVLRLITVRNYAPMIENSEPDVAAVLDALMVFLLEISLKLRLDRLDGVGRMACYGEDVVPEICSGFFRGVQMAADERGLPDDFEVAVREYAALHDTAKLDAMASIIIEKAPFDLEERNLLQRIFQSHSSVLAGTLAG